MTSTPAFVSPVATLRKFAQQKPNTIFLRQPFDGGQLRDYTWAQAENHCARMAQALLNLGLSSGDKVAILSKNCAEWFLADWAIQWAGLISVPIYPTAGVDTIQYVLDHSEAKVVIVGKLDDWQSQEPGVNPDLVRIAMPFETMACQHQWNDLVANTEPMKEPADLTVDDTLSIMYTSGSTGKPKGVVVTLGAYNYASQTNVTVAGLAESDRFISYLPLAHITERAVIQGPALYCGSTVYFVESLDTFQHDLQTARPTKFLSVPRLWTKFQTGVYKKLPPTKLKILLAIPGLNKLIAKKIRQGLGLDECDLFGSGTAPISPATLHWYHRIGIPISEGWGMTETCGLSCTNITFNPSMLGTIGNPIPGTEIKVSDQGELLIRTPGLFKEYYKQPELTKESFTEDGFFKTGDKVERDEKLQAFRITGRVKDLFKTEKGKYVAPVPIESKLADNPNIEQICVMGSGQPQPVAVVVLSENGQELTKEDATVSLETTLNKVNLTLEAHEKLARVIVADSDWTIDNGLLTPTMKIKRDLIENQYTEVVAQAAQQQVVWQMDAR